MTITAGYREWAAPPTLRPLLACLWSSRDQPSTLVLPDGCTDIIWRHGHGAFVAGPDTGPVPAPAEPGALLVGVRFRPGTGGDLLGVPLSELRDQRVDLADLRPDVGRILPADLTPDQVAVRLTQLSEQLAGQLPGRPDPAVRAACRLLTSPVARAEDVAAQVGLSPRQLRRRCEAAVGYGPKMLQRVLRFRRFVSLVDATGGAADLAEAAVTSGYADQPHLTRESVQLAGLPPAALVRTRHPRLASGS
ncbi:MAG TPA: helix-turn-helix domain-containing protein [Streptosporangiaceae bacterium]|nr:helix-turn-helix domain-containing protein [Streptosporangiaceae bacterium]